MRVLHAYCLNYNIGDYALGIGVKNLLRHYLPIELIGETNLQGRVFDEYYIEEVVNKRYTLLVIGGGGIIHGAHWPYGWFWLIKQNLIKKIKIPLIIYGVGYNYFKGETGIPERGVKHLGETIRQAAYFSVRNDRSYERLKDQTSYNVPEIPDPGFHVALNSTYYRPVEEPYVLVQLANDKPENRFGNEANKIRFVQNMRHIVTLLSKRYKVILTPHVLDDVYISHEVVKGISNAEVWDFGYFAFDHCMEALAYYKYADFVLAMRGHGQIVPIGFNIPVISLENHTKNRGLMEKLGLGYLNVDILDQEFLQKIQQLIEHVENERVELCRNLEAINHDLTKQTGKAFVDITSRLHV